MTYNDWPYIVLLYLAFGVIIGFLYWFSVRKEMKYFFKDLIDFIGIFALLWAPLPFLAAGWYVFDKVKQLIERKEK